MLALTNVRVEPPESYAKRIRTTPGALVVKASDLAHNADPARLAVLDEHTRAADEEVRRDAGAAGTAAGLTVAVPVRRWLRRSLAHPRAGSVASRLKAHSMLGSIAKRKTRRTGAVHKQGDGHARDEGHEDLAERPVQPRRGSSHRKVAPLTRKPCSR